MSVPASPKVVQLFLHVLRVRGWIAGAFLILAAAGIYGAVQVPNDPAIERLVVAGDPIALATSEFDRLFPEGEQALIMLEAADPLNLSSLRAADGLERELAKIPHVEAHSLLCSKDGRSREAHREVQDEGFSAVSEDPKARC